MLWGKGWNEASFIFLGPLLKLSGPVSEDPTPQGKRTALGLQGAVLLHYGAMQDHVSKSGRDKRERNEVQARETKQLRKPALLRTKRGGGYKKIS